MINTKPIIIAHRGESYEAPENTFASISLAWERNDEAIEIDIQLSKDYQIVVIHDTNTLRTGGKDKKVEKQTLTELRKLDFGIFKDEKWKNEKIPTLNDVLKIVPQEKKIIIEIKCGNTIIPILKKEILESKLNQSQIEIIAFNLNTISLAKKELPKLKMFWLIDLENNFLKNFFLPSVNKIISLTKKNNLDGIDISVSKKLNWKFIEKIKLAGLKIYTWTIDNPQQAEFLSELGIDGITTNRAEWLREKIKHY